MTTEQIEQVPTEPAPPPKPKFFRRRWVQITGTALAAFLVGGVAGGAGASSANDKALAAEQRADAADARASQAQDQVAKAKADATTQVAQAKTEAQNSVADQLTAAQKVKADADAAAAKVKADADAAAKTAADAAAKTKADLDARATALTNQEADAKANEFDGDGIYRVPEDVKPGTYKAAASAGCYYARLSAIAGSGIDNIIENNNVSGAVVITVKPSDKGLEVSNCGTFKKVG